MTEEAAPRTDAPHESEPRVADDEAGVVNATAQIEAFVSSGSSEVLEKVLDRHLVAPLTEETFRAVRDAGMLVMGDDGFSIVVWVASRQDKEKALEALELSEAARDWFKGVIAIYGHRLNRALHMSDVLASRRDDWESFGWSVRVNPANGEHEMNAEIQKYNGEKLMVTAGLPSVIRLASRVLEPLTEIENLDPVDEEDRDELLAAVEIVRRKLAPSQSSVAMHEE